MTGAADGAEAPLLITVAPNSARKTELKWKRQHGSTKNPPHTADAAIYMTLVPEADPLYHLPKIVADTEP